MLFLPYSLSPTNAGYYSRVFSPFWHSEMIVNIKGDGYGSILIFTVLGFWPFWAVFGRFWHFWGFGGDLGVLGVLVSFKITRGIKLVVGRVTEGVKEGLREF